MTSVKCATRRANITIATSTPTTTPMARLWVSTVTTTVDDHDDGLALRHPPQRGRA